MLLAERLLLLNRKLDGSPVTSEAHSAQELNRFLAIACICELCAMGRIGSVGSDIMVVNDVSAHYMLLNDVQAVLARRALPPAQAIDAVARAMPRIATDLLASLVVRGRLIEEKRRHFGIFSKSVFSVQSTSAYNESRDLVQKAADNLGLADLWALALVLLCDSMDLLSFQLPELSLELDGRLNRFEAFVSSVRTVSDQNAVRARLIFTLARCEAVA
jgi:hypothetical protein